MDVVLKTLRIPACVVLLAGLVEQTIRQVPPLQMVRGVHDTKEQDLVHRVAADAAGGAMPKLCNGDNTNASITRVNRVFFINDTSFL